ncbi:MAG TPA: MFS transporter [Candidatus Eremiobacteraceae bacterium]|nr:MFS transporter [Candidatus Eremiobacteraceae bacterium]
MAHATPAEGTLRLGLRENFAQFALLVLINAFVGGMVGLERSILPLLGRDLFHIASTAVVLSFIVSFGVVKALTNLAGSRLSDRVGRRRLLVAGWAIGLLVPVILLHAPTWGWVVFANVLLGINQGLCWSMTVVMKIDLVGPKSRGVAMGFNEAAGYVAVAAVAYFTAVLAAKYGLRPVPFELGIGIALAGFWLSLLFVRETHGYAKHEARSLASQEQPSFSAIFTQTSFRDPALASCSQAGFVNNLNDGMVWGLVPLMAAAAGFSLAQIGLVVAAYPFVWGVVQLGTGALSDVIGRKWLIAGGMTLQAVAIGIFAATRAYPIWLAAAIVLGVGTAMVYPTLLAAIGDVAHPQWRASAVGVYRLWRDSGYAAGALLSGIIADLAGVTAAVVVIAALTLASGGIVAVRMPETLATRTANESS